MSEYKHPFQVGDIALAVYDSAELEILTPAIPMGCAESIHTGVPIQTCMAHRVRRLRDRVKGWAKPEDLRRQEPSWLYIGEICGTDFRYRVIR